MKTFSLNLVTFIGFMVAFLTMYAGLPGVVLTPAIVKVFGIIITVGSILLKTKWFASQDWKGGGWDAAIWSVNIAYVLIAIFTDLMSSGIVAAGVGLGITQTLNLFITYFGGGKPELSKA